MNEDEDTSTEEIIEDTGEETNTTIEEEVKPQEEKKEGNNLIFYLLIGLVVLVGAYSIMQTNAINTQLGTITQRLDKVEGVISGAGQPAAQPKFDINKLAEGGPVIGQPDAKLTIVEFSDFQCPYCGKFYTDSYGKIYEEYIKTGKVKFVYKDFPLSSIHPYAQKAAEGGKCATEQSKFWEYYNKVYANQATLNLDNLKLWAVELGMDATKFNECLDKGKYTSAVSDDTNLGTSAGVQGTPAFFIGTQLVVGAQPYANFKTVIDKELAK